jgi:hypothetical protein
MATSDLCSEFPIYVRVVGVPSSTEDAAVPGTFRLQVRMLEPVNPLNMDAGLAHEVHEAALDEFHARHGIDVLDDFSIEVLDCAGRAIRDSDAAREPRRLVDRMDFDGPIDDAFVPARVVARGRPPR